MQSWVADRVRERSDKGGGGGGERGEGGPIGPATVPFALRLPAGVALRPRHCALVSTLRKGLWPELGMQVPLPNCSLTDFDAPIFVTSRFVRDSSFSRMTCHEWGQGWC